MRLFLTFSSIALLLFSCKEEQEFEFDRTALLNEVATNQIIPNYDELVTKIEMMKTAIDAFELSASEANLLAIRAQFSSAYLAFQNVKMFEFGPAADYGFQRSSNTYPTDTTQINANIESGAYSLTSVSNTASIGFPAIDYLIHNGSNEFILNAFTSETFASNRMIYLKDLCTKLNTEASGISASWNAGYNETFIASDGTDISSSISILFNQFVIDLELVKNAKIGVPAGQYSGGEPFPTYVESYYSGASKSLAIANLNALKAVFTGGTGIGMDDYMDASVEFGTTTIPSSEITNQFDVCIASIEALTDPFSASIPVDAAGFSSAYQELKKLVAYAKTDIPAALGVLISFSDTDGD